MMKEIKFKYVIPENMKDCHVNGAWGTTDLSDNVYVALYYERQPIPKTVEHNFLEKTGTPGSVKVNSPCDVVRTVQASCVMSVGTAKALADWLNEKVDEINQRNKPAEASPGPQKLH